jgi:hypothetical protein
VDNGGLRYGAVEGALRPPLPTATQSGPSRPSFSAFAGPKNPPSLDRSVGAQHHRLDPRKRTLGGRLQIGTVAGFGSESVAGFLLELVAGFVGIRTALPGVRQILEIAEEDNRFAKRPGFISRTLHRNPPIGESVDFDDSELWRIVQNFFARLPWMSATPTAGIPG